MFSHPFLSCGLLAGLTGNRSWWSGLAPLQSVSKWMVSLIFFPPEGEREDKTAFVGFFTILTSLFLKGSFGSGIIDSPRASSKRS